MKRVLLIAQIAHTNAVPNGVNIKNTHILKYLQNQNHIKLTVLNTSNWKSHAILLMFRLLYGLFKHDTLILSINTNSAYKIIKLCHWLKQKHKLLYIAVGGQLPDKLKSKTLKSSYYQGLAQIFVQTKTMAEDLKALSLNHTTWMNNSKYFPKIDIDYSRKPSLPLKCFYLGRIHPEKGIELIFAALKDASLAFTVDFFGPIEPAYETDFYAQIKENDHAHYHGVIDLNENAESYQTLSQYDLFLFPTHWHGEGFPGVIIDAFISGVAVLASDWQHNHAVVQNKVNGCLFEAKSLSDFKEKLSTLIHAPETVQSMKHHAFNEAKLYHSSVVLKKLDKYL